MTLPLRLTWTFALLGFLGIAGWGATAQDSPLPNALQGAPHEFEPQVRGPLHEAIAQPNDFQPDAAAPIAKEPPPLINELPPEEKPEGQNVEWISGYWGWDAERNDFIWVSGVYRDAPVGRRFVPGYWAHTAEGWRWVSGFWAPEGQEEVPYVPAPPATLENGPSLPPPGDDSLYVPGSWIYRETDYAWRPGYWSLAREGRVWVAPRYLWTPAGCVFVDGYWDYPLEERGLVFAPVYFDRPYWQRDDWFYRPSFVVGWGSIFNSAFYRRGGSHFFFGNYYGNNYARLGYQPWFAGRGRYDSHFGHHHHRHQRNDRDWFANVQRDYHDRNEGRAAVPPQSFAQQQERSSARVTNNNNVTVRNDIQQVVTPLSQARAEKNVRLVKANDTFQENAKVNMQRSRELAQTRKKQEANVASLAPVNSSTGTQQVRTLRLPTPVASTAPRLNTAPRVSTNPPGVNNAGPAAAPVGSANVRTLKGPALVSEPKKGNGPTSTIIAPPAANAGVRTPKGSAVVPPPSATLPAPAPLPAIVERKGNGNPPVNVQQPPQAPKSIEKKGNANPPVNVQRPPQVVERPAAPPPPPVASPPAPPRNVTPPVEAPKFNVPRSTPPVVSQPAPVVSQPKLTPAPAPAPRVAPPPVSAPRLTPPPAPAPVQRVAPAPPPAPRAAPPPAPAPRSVQAPAAPQVRSTPPPPRQSAPASAPARNVNKKK